jgi:Ni/Fe-hydrogenase subunit HybB-like protein
MSTLLSPGLVLVFALGIGAPLILIAGARHLVMRLADRAATVKPPVPRALPRLPGRGLTLRWTTARFLLATMMGIGVGIILLRFVSGLGAVTNLSDQFTWGLWISFDVMCGVALAAGAFVMAATVHIFRLDRFEPLVRPAILTGLLGYLLVVAGLVVDLGRPYNVWRPLVHWQHHSVLWEVGVCVATYTTVLLIEFLPVILERVNQVDAISKRLPTRATYRLLRRVGIVFVILGVVLSTLHQSSLGSLMVILPTKLSPIWYSVYLPVFFWFSAVAVGLAMTIVEATLSARAFGRGLETHLLASLAKAASVVLLIYLAIRSADLLSRHAWPLIFEPTLQAVSFWAEIGLGVVLPIILFAVRPWRMKPKVLFSGAILVVLFGVVLNRFNVSMIGLLPYTGNVYTPSWTEFVVSFTLVSFGVIAFALAAKHLPVFEAEHSPSAGTPH